MNDKTLDKRCPLSVPMITKLLQICLECTYFTFRGQYYKQTKGTAMGSPVSPIVANLYMEQFEQKALATSPCPVYVWMRYVDDTFAVLHMYDIDSFLNHINSQDPNIKFTIEEEQDGKLPFLDTCVIVNDDGSLSTTVYRKATHTDQYLNYKSNHPLEHKRSVVRTLLHRANTIIPEKHHRANEIHHVKGALKANEYPRWVVSIPRKPRIKKTEPRTEGMRKPAIGVPYMKGVSEPLKRVFDKYGAKLYHVPTNPIRSILMDP